MRAVAGGTLLAGRLLAAQRRLIGVELLGGGLDRAEIHIGRHFGLVAIIAQHRLQDIVHALGEHAFHAAAVVELFTGHGQLGVFTLVRQQIAFLVDHGDLRLAQLRHAGGHQIDDGQHLPRLQRTPRVQLDQYRSAGLAFIAYEYRAFRDGQMHPGTLDVVEAGNGPRQFAFKATTIACGFHELAGTQALVLVENLETDIAVGRGYASSGQLEAGTGDIICLDQQGAGVGLDGVGNVGGGQGFHDLLGIHTGQAAVQRPVIGLLGPQHHGKADRYARRQADHQADLTQHGHIAQVVEEGQAKQRFAAACLGRNIIRECICHDLISPLNRHLHDVLVSLNQLVTYLGQGLERNAGLLRSDHHVSQVDPAFADLERVG